MRGFFGVCCGRVSDFLRPVFSGVSRFDGGLFDGVAGVFGCVFSFRGPLISDPASRCCPGLGKTIDSIRELTLKPGPLPETWQ